MCRIVLIPVSGKLASLTIDYYGSLLVFFVKSVIRASLFAGRCLGGGLLRDALNVLMWETVRPSTSPAKCFSG